MKSTIKPLILGCLLLAGKFGSAQDVAGIKNQAKGNIFKVNLSSLLLKNGSFQYERVVKRNFSYALGFSILPKSDLPFAGTLKDQFGSNADAKRAIETTQLSNYSITPEVRFYMGKKGAPAGFYLAPFVRYQHMSFDQIYQYTASNNKVHNPRISGTINNIGAGLMMGTQWNLSKSLTLDWWIAGPIFGSSNGHLVGTDDMSDLSTADRQKLKSDIESTDIPLTKIEATIGTNQVDVNLSGPYVGIRAFGFALGIKF
jgi:hypothetical protein